MPYACFGPMSNSEVSYQKYSLHSTHLKPAKRLRCHCKLKVYRYTNSIWHIKTRACQVQTTKSVLSDITQLSALHVVKLTNGRLYCTCNHCLMHAGYLFTEQGIASCAVNTSAAVGTTFTVKFMVFDYSISSLNASVTRTISIIDPCDSGEYLCSDGTCSTVACDLRYAVPSCLQISFWTVCFWVALSVCKPVWLACVFSGV